MSKYAVFQCWALFLAPAVFLQTAQAETYQDRNRVLVTYSTETDHCYGLTTRSKHEAKEAANSACRDSFLALDRLESNSCKGWRRPKCRQLQLPDFDYFECSCKISSITYFDIRSDVVTPFRDCAWRVFAEDVFYGSHAGGPSVSYQSTQQRIYDAAVQKARVQRDAPVVAGTSYASVDTRAGGSSVRAGGPSVRAGSKRSRTSSKNSEVPTFAANQGRMAKGTELGPPYECDICGYRYLYQTSMVAHRKIHQEVIRCDSCNRDFSNKPNLRLHNKRKHPEIFKAQAAEEEAQRILDKPFGCELCGTRFSCARTLRYHMAVHRGETICQHCNRKFARKATLNAHIKSEHPEAEL